MCRLVLVSCSLRLSAVHLQGRGAEADRRGGGAAAASVWRRAEGVSAVRPAVARVALQQSPQRNTRRSGLTRDKCCALVGLHCCSTQLTLCASPASPAPWLR